MIPQAVPEISTPKSPSESLSPRPDVLFAVIACIFLALAQVLWAGYQLGVGNQAIQIPFLETLHNGHLFTRDAMVVDTIRQYPSWFFYLCAPLLNIITLPSLYLSLDLLVTIGVFLSVYSLSRSLFRERGDHWAALITLLFMLAGHHQALAGESLYSTGLTHTWAAFPLTLLALALYYRGLYWTCFALLGLIFNFHALEAGHLLLLLGFVSLCQIKKIGLTRLLALANVFLIMASPTLVLLLRQHAGTFDTSWQQLMHVRSADHSFPTSWWQPGSPDVPQFFCILSLAAVALGIGKRTPERRTTFFLAIGVGLLFLVGYLFAEVWAVPIVIRAQLFRSSRVVLVLALVIIGHACYRAWMLPWKKDRAVSALSAWIEFASACLTAVSLAIPSLLPLLPWALLVATLSSLISARLAWYQAPLAGAALLVCLFAWQSLLFMVPGLSPITLHSLADFHPPPPLAIACLGIAIALWLGAYAHPKGMLRAYGLVLSAGAAIGLLLAVFPTLRAASLPDAPWMNIQIWARDHTPVDALFLTPAQQSGFRIYSERAVVGEWRDGTQLYFSAAYTPVWWDRMSVLQPGIKLSPDGRELYYQGRQLGELDDDQIIEIAKKYKADYVVLPRNNTRQLSLKYSNDQWSIYLPKIAATTIVTTTGPAPVESNGPPSPFMSTVVLPNIEKNRKSDARVQVVDASGQPAEGVTFSVVEKRSGFGFGCSLPFFKSPAIDFGGDYKPPPVTTAQLQRFTEMFTYSVIPFSGNWALIEPKSGAADYADLDAYVNWCVKNSVRVEFSYLTGNLPRWMQSKSRSEQNRLTLAHAHELVQRYGNKIASWQVDSEKIGEPAVPSVITDLRKLNPKIRLGIAEDARFWSPRTGPAKDADLQRGVDELRLLKTKNAPVDFISIEASQPEGLWADEKDIYQSLDTFAKEGVRIHITQVGVPIGARIEGPGHGDTWTPELQARYYQQFFTICFSHPNVDVINLFAFASKSWLDGEGLLDDNDQPTIAFNTLKQLITRQWHTELSGTFGIDGAAKFRGFQGEYDLTVNLPNGKTATAPFTIAPGQSNQFRFQLDSAAGKLTATEAH